MSKLDTLMGIVAGGIILGLLGLYVFIAIVFVEVLS